MSARMCPAHGAPLVTHGELCPECDGAGEDGPDLGDRWGFPCVACHGSGLRYCCPACEQERDDDEEAQEEERYLRYLEGRNQ
jgi:hypothetical protein